MREKVIGRALKDVLIEITCRRWSNCCCLSQIKAKVYQNSNSFCSIWIIFNNQLVSKSELYIWWEMRGIVSESTSSINNQLSVTHVELEITFPPAEEVIVNVASPCRSHFLKTSDISYTIFEGLVNVSRVFWSFERVP